MIIGSGPQPIQSPQSTPPTTRGGPAARVQAPTGGLARTGPGLQHGSEVAQLMRSVGKSASPGGAMPFLVSEGGMSEKIIGAKPKSMKSLALEIAGEVVLGAFKLALEAAS
ncbi:MAG: hypothetical protein ACAI44_25570 [Candidatus Sericytochromatia bacterium]